MMQRLDTTNAEFAAQLDALTSWEAASASEITETARGIVDDVRQRGDAALIEYTNRFDRRAVEAASELLVTPGTDGVAQELLDALHAAAERVREYHEHQVQKSWDFTDADGSRLGQQVQPLDRVGVYVPGGKAAYPSSVLMNVIPAKVAGVEDIVMVVPAPDGQLEPVVLAAAAIAGVDRIFSIGGAQAVAALAYGTDTVPAVDKIVGPGNAYVAAAKSLVFGRVGIDMIAGPSEILIVCDGDTDPDWIAMDLFSQAEHDEQAQSILISPDAEFLDDVQKSVDKLLPTMERKDVIDASLSGRGAMIRAQDMEDAIALVNRIAPEHLELSIANARDWLPRIKHAGAIFLGRYTAEALGDYCAGPNHVLPTAGTARFSSPLGVYDFQKRSSVIECSPTGSANLGRVASVLARGEGLSAHARSAEYRVEADRS